MPSASRPDILQPHELSDEDARLWSGFVAGRPDLQGPYFDLRYIRAIAPAVPQSAIARFRDGDRITGYFPYQVRSGVLQPMGAPMSDYHGIIAPQDFVPDLNALIKAAGAGKLEFQGWIGALNDKVRSRALTRRVAEVPGDYDAWYATQNAANHKFFKNIARCQRNIDKDFGGFDFTWERVTPELLAWTLDLKRAQYKKSGMHDVFACGWTEAALKQLAAFDDPEFGLRAGVFRHEGRCVAAEISLVGAEDVHLWFPAYDPTYYRYSVGILLTLAIIRHLAPLGVRRFDFGTGGEDYKSPMTVCAGTVHEGELNLGPRLVSPMLDLVAGPDLRLSVQRRIKVIRATETDAAGWGRALARLGERTLSRMRERLTPKPV